MEVRKILGKVQRNDQPRLEVPMMITKHVRTSGGDSSGKWNPSRVGGDRPA